ncbi:TauD/TfdA family dioxygenase [Kordia sp.]|uniref:TauD/TfdA family dioxygenase n=1 Tax=Kordia sp. TaxID=1965332 RepID=UPI0025BBB573|nr:TauD/TfdA family dioxygenase [Kordia sp.]MCH2195465.1 TauD/TfdA family dioxygenase [Kordia sp.]
MKNQLLKLRNMGAVQTMSADVVKTSFLDNGLNFPLVLESAMSDVILEKWMVDNRTDFEEKLRKHGGILCRGFGIDTVEKFQSLMDKFPNELLDYAFRSSPRFEITNNVYVSTTYPPDEIINMHSESSYAPTHPSRIVFCCIIAAEERGETPIADNRLILQHMSDELKQKFMEKGVQYRRYLNSFMGLGWEEVFQTEDKAVVEAECKKNGMDFTWVSDKELVLTWTKKAIWEHPVTGELAWFNHSLFFNKYMLPDSILNAVENDDQLPNNTFFGDGTPISKEEIEEIKTAYKKSTVMFPWEEGDVLFLDNMFASHGRNSYKGERKIIVSMS